MTGKALVFLLFAFLLVLSSSSSILRPAAAQIYVDVTVSQAKEMIDTHPSLVILDVRNQSEYDARHIRNAKLIPVWNLTQNVDELNKNDEILVYCAAGFRSANASATLVSNGFLHVYNMLEGINGWIAARYQVYVKYASIQAAIENATSGQAIYVSSGFYNESLTVGRPMTLVGENASTTIINAPATVITVDADNVSISDFTIRYVGCACYGYSSVSVTDSQNVNVTSNVILSDDFGIHLAGAKGVVVAHNTVTHSGDASIVVLSSSEVSVFENDLTGMGGMEIDNSTKSVFSSNTVLASAFVGIFIGESHDNTFFGNNVSAIALMALSISSAYNNTFFDNDIFSGSAYGLFIWQSFNNSIFHNSFLGNGSQVFCQDNSTNLWDNGLEGNYWSNYTGVDADSNGIGDRPYIINSTNPQFTGPTVRDNYPLMGLFYTFNISVNNEVSVMSNSSIADFEYVKSNSTIMLKVSNTTADQTTGFCRMSIPHSLIDPYNGSISVVIDNGQTPVLFLNNTLYDDGTNRWIYFIYPQSTHSIGIISVVPEFSASLILTLFMTGTVTIVAIYKRKHVNPRLRNP
jgi:parallel beta-helix repeat protein